MLTTVPISARRGQAAPSPPTSGPSTGGRRGCRPAARCRHPPRGRRCSTPSHHRAGRRRSSRRRPPATRARWPSRPRPVATTSRPAGGQGYRTYDAAHASAERYRRQLPEHGDIDRLRPRLVAEHLRPHHRARRRGPGGDQEASSSRSSTSSPRSAVAWPRCRSAWTCPTGSRTTTSTSTSTSATTPWRHRGPTSSSPKRCPASCPGRSTAAGRCGSSTSSKASRTGGSRSSPRCTTPPSTARQGRSCSPCSSTPTPTSRPTGLPAAVGLRGHAHGQRAVADHDGRVPAPAGEAAAPEPPHDPRAGGGLGQRRAAGPHRSRRAAPSRPSRRSHADPPAQRLRQGGRPPALAPAHAGAEDAVQPADHGPPPPVVHHHPPRSGQGGSPGLRLHLQRRGDGTVRGHVAALPHQARRAPRRAADRHGAGEHPRRGRGRHLPEPRVRLCWPAWRPTRRTPSSGSASSRSR